jgi:ankyrin repeat protein
MKSTLTGLKHAMEEKGLSVIPDTWEQQLTHLKTKVFEHIESKEKNPLAFDKIPVVGTIVRFFYTMFSESLINREFQNVENLINKEKTETKTLLQWIMPSDTRVEEVFEDILTGKADILTALKKRGIDLNKPDERGYTPLTRAILEGNSSMVSSLKKAGVDLNAPDGWGYTPLTATVLENNKKIFAVLKRAWADLNTADRNGYTPLTSAINQNKMWMFTALIQAGADVNQSNTTRQFPPSDQEIPKEADIRKAFAATEEEKASWRKTGHTPLTMAIHCGSIEIVKALIEAGARLDEKDDAGHTPLTMAVLANNQEMIQVLVEAGAKLDMKDGNNHTPLALAHQLLDKANDDNRAQRQSIVDILTKH